MSSIVFPVYYYSNHNAVSGPGLIEINNAFIDKLDYELEIVIIIGKKGRDIPPDLADSYIYGFSIMNDFSSRQIQMDEMKLNLGPAKGKDFATTIGPYIITKDELNDSIIKTKKGNQYDIELSCTVNGIKYSLIILEICIGRLLKSYPKSQKGQHFILVT